MNKVVTILVIVILFSRMVTFGQFVFPNKLDTNWINPLMNKSATVIEGDVISQKEILHKTSSDSDDEERGGWYILYQIKPTSVLKGNVDSSKTFEVLIQAGGYLKSQGSFIKSNIIDGGSFIMHGLYFLSGERTIPDYCTSFANAINVYCFKSLNYGDYKNGRAEVLNFFDEKLNIKPKLLDDGLEKKSPNEVNKSITKINK